MQFDDVKYIIYHAISYGLNSKAFADLQSAVASNPYLIVLEKYGNWYNYEYINQIYQFDFFDHLGEPISEIWEGNWHMKIPKVSTNEYVQMKFIYAQMTDPEGEKSKEKKFGEGLGGVLKALKVLRKMAEFECLEHYNLFLENEALSKDIDKKKSLIDEMSIELSLNDAQSLIKSNFRYHDKRR